MTIEHFLEQLPQIEGERRVVILYDLPDRKMVIYDCVNEMRGYTLDKHNEIQGTFASAGTLSSEQKAELARKMAKILLDIA
jgi:hypothetical protein